MARYRVTRSTLIVTKPDGTVIQRDVMLSYDAQLDLFEVTFIGDSALKGYSFGVVQSEFKRVRDSGELVDALPKVS